MQSSPPRVDRSLLKHEVFGVRATFASTDFYDEGVHPVAPSFRSAEGSYATQGIKQTEVMCAQKVWRTRCPEMTDLQLAFECARLRAQRTHIVDPALTPAGWSAALATCVRSARGVIVTVVVHLGLGLGVEV